MSVVSDRMSGREADSRISVQDNIDIKTQW